MFFSSIVQGGTVANAHPQARESMCLHQTCQITGPDNTLETARAVDLPLIESHTLHTTESPTRGNTTPCKNW